MTSVKNESAKVSVRSWASSRESSIESHDPDEVMYTNCRMEQLPCFHDITRNVAENLLLNVEEGGFLIRPSHQTGNYSVSVRMANSVKHFQIHYNGQFYCFGQAQFWSPLEIWVHLQNSPVLECEEGVTAHLLQPYLSELKSRIELPESLYSKVIHHCTSTPDERRRSSAANNIVTSKEGMLYKKKRGKTWKNRWCILNKNFLSYKRSEKDKKELKSLDLSKALFIVDDNTEFRTKKNCFRIQFQSEHYIFASDSPEDKDTWYKVIKWQIDAARQSPNDRTCGYAGTLQV